MRIAVVGLCSHAYLAAAIMAAHEQHVDIIVVGGIEQDYAVVEVPALDSGTLKESITEAISKIKGAQSSVEELGKSMQQVDFKKLASLVDNYRYDAILREDTTRFKQDYEQRSRRATEAAKRSRYGGAKLHSGRANSRPRSSLANPGRRKN